MSPVTAVRVIGHADRTGSDAIDDPLSARRATRVREPQVAQAPASEGPATSITADSPVLR
jgi:outer membrane protein OmpA-like peptidoglycan-associated protein